MNNKEKCSCSENKISFPIITEETSCCSASTEAQMIIPGLNQQFVVGTIDTPVGKLPQVTSQLKWQDNWGTFKARFGVDRMDYIVDPGLYALGNPDNNSSVFVSANYKMSFDYLRRELPGRSAWILVLDTKGINVWCAAGKGTFGTEELIKRIAASRLNEVVTHRKLILPQLGAPGVSAHAVKQISGFKAYFGPVRAEDLPVYLDAGMKATPAMRVVTFPLKERAVLIPIEAVAAIKPFLIIAPILFILGGIGSPAGFWANVFNYGLFAVVAFFCAIIAGAVINPLLLPYLPFRAFSLKGAVLGIAAAIILLYLRDIDLQTGTGRIESLAWILIVPAVSSYLAMNFTGCSTYTSLSGVKREMRWALPFQLAAVVCGLATWIGSRLIS